MRVLLIDVTCKIGSTGKIVYNMYNYINSQGNEAAVCFGRGPKVKDKNIYKFGLNWETYLHAFLTRVTGWTGCFSYFSTKRLIRFIKNNSNCPIFLYNINDFTINIIMSQNISICRIIKKLNKLILCNHFIRII